MANGRLTSLELLQEVYRDPMVPLHTRIRCAIEAAPYEYPKKPSSMSIHYDETFAGRLERAVLIVERRLISPKVIEHDEQN